MTKDICLECKIPLTFISDKKKEYKYCKKCYCDMIKLGNKRCGCGSFLRQCYFYSQCKKYSVKCKSCERGWIDEYCDSCR